MEKDKIGAAMTKDYNKKSVYQQGIIAYLAKEKLPAALASFTAEHLASEAPFAIADYGSAGGANSLQLFDAAIEHV